MSLKMTNRFYQIVSTVVLLMLAVALTTALVVAAERSSESSRKTVWHNGNLQVPSVEQPGPMGWV